MLNYRDPMTLTEEEINHILVDILRFSKAITITKMEAAKDKIIAETMCRKRSLHLTLKFDDEGTYMDLRQTNGNWTEPVGKLAKRQIEKYLLSLGMHHLLKCNEYLTKEKYIVTDKELQEELDNLRLSGKPIGEYVIGMYLDSATKLLRKLNIRYRLTQKGIVFHDTNEGESLIVLEVFDGFVTDATFFTSSPLTPKEEPTEDLRPMTAEELKSVIYHYDPILFNGCLIKYGEKIFDGYASSNTTLLIYLLGKELSIAKKLCEFYNTHIKIRIKDKRPYTDKTQSFCQNILEVEIEDDRIINILNFISGGK